MAGPDRLSGILRSLARADLGTIPPDPGAFLAALAGPCAIAVPGRDGARTRVVTTLLHGNEPSGFVGAHRWLREGRTPAVDTLLIIANVEAALAEPGFHYRMLPGRTDLNRCFKGPFDTADGALAREILDTVASVSPEALIDVHNNTGHNPPYGVGVEPTRAALQLVALFGDRYVWSHLSLGALMEVLPDFPAVTVEVGRSGDPRADDVAHAGLTEFLGRDRLFDAPDTPDVRVLLMPMRVCLRPGARLAISDETGAEPGGDADLTIFQDLDRHNFETVASGTPVGFVRGDEWPLTLIDEEGQDRAREWFAIDAGVLRTKRSMIPIMITTDPVAATSDCLFYVVREVPGPS